jgi:hypothetical protein
MDQSRSLKASARPADLVPMSAIGLRSRNKAGRSAQTRFNELQRAWRSRVIPRPLAVGFPIVFAALLLFVILVHPRSHLAFGCGFFLGGLLVIWIAVPETLMPAYIHRWQLGAWGEEKTASELKRLRSKEWTVRHDVAWGVRANHDHIVAGNSVYLINTKNVPDSRVTIEGDVLRVSQLDDEDQAYIADRWIPVTASEAHAVRRELAARVGFPVWAYPVVVVWGAFPAKIAYVGDVALVHGLHLAEWLADRPTDLILDWKRERVRAAVADLPAAGRG